MIRDQRKRLEEIFEEMRKLQLHFLQVHGVSDIWSNSKIYEVLQANTLGHKLIPGHSGSLDACDDSGGEYEYKHFKESSSNHSWTFNDYSDTTIKKLRDQVHSVIFAHIDDEVYPPRLDWSYEVSGIDVANYLTQYTQGMANTRKMINISANQLQQRLGTTRTNHNKKLSSGRFGVELNKIFQLVSELEQIVGVANILTSNKFWEVLASLPLGHTVNSEQGGRAGAHDAQDERGNDYEYKVSATKSWSFQDISPAVLDKYLKCEDIVLVVVDKTNIHIESIWMAKPDLVVPRLKSKLAQKAVSYASKNKEIRRLQVSLTAGDLDLISARKIV